MKKKIDTDLIVLTGGPGAGKTAVLEIARKALCEHVVVFPESASILFKGGFWRLESETAKRAAQRAIYHVQQEMQTLVLEEKKWGLGLCDRGTLDGLAYWPDGEADFYQTLKTTQAIEYAKYRAVIHLRSPDLAGGYNYENPMRTETPELAALIDQKIHNIWKHHPRYHVIECQDDFTHKVNLTLQCVRSYIPLCCKVK